ncbi:hypothetical protein WAI453_010564 [Rhynchosporium graminicola]
MLPQETSDSCNWDDSHFADWLQVSPEKCSHDVHSSRGMKVADLLSSPSSLRPAESSASKSGIALGLGDGLSGGLFRSPRSDNLVALCRRNSVVERDEPKKGKIREAEVSETENNLAPYPFEDLEQWHRREFAARAEDLDPENYNFKTQLFDTYLSYKRGISRDGSDDQYLMSPSQSYTNLLSPTWGRARHGSSSSDLNYDNMEIEELMQDMEMYSDTEYEQNEDLSDPSRTLFGHSCWPLTSSSKTSYISAGEKRRASPGLEMPDLKKQRRIPNPLNCENLRLSSSQPLLMKRAGNQCIGNQVLKSPCVSNPLKRERVVYLPHPLDDTKSMLYGFD